VLEAAELGARAGERARARGEQPELVALTGYDVDVEPLFQWVTADAAPALRAAFAGVLLLLVIACANVALLLLMRGTARGRDLAIRAALGGGRSRVALQQVSEGVLLALAGGALGTPELLLSQGLANGSGHVGRHLHVQPACWVGARFDGRQVRGWDGVMQSWRVDEWLNRRVFLEATFTPLAFGAPWLPGAGAALKERIERYGELGIVGVHLADTSEGRVRVGRRGELRLSYRLTRDDARRLRFGIARAAEIHFAAGATEVYPQVGGLRSIGPGEEAKVEEGLFSPSALRLEAFHPMGTARMGPDPRTSVVGTSGESHEVSCLYVADASVLPSALGANPMLTIMACARRIARGMAERLT